MSFASPAGLRALARQFTAFFGVGIAAAIVHYGLLVSLVEGYRMDPVRATLVGYVGGGIVSYLLNRRHTYASARPHREAGWRFAAVALVGFGLTWLVMALFVRGMGLPYLPAQIVTTGIVLLWSFMAHKLWTFREPPALVP
jgi:putative flippase GtrA